MTTYTRTMAAREVMHEWKSGTDMHGMEFSKLCQRKLKEHNLKWKPMDGTWMRYMRMFGKEYGVALKNRNQSLYTKE